MIKQLRKYDRMLIVDFERLTYEGEGTLEYEM